MSEKRMLIMPAELVKKIDDNRGDMTQVEFIDFLIDGQLKEETKISFDSLATKAWRENIKIWLPFITIGIEESILEPEPIAPMIEAGAEGVAEGIVGVGL